MQPTVQTLLDRPELALSLLTPAPDLPAGALAAPIAWAHSSDLADPTPFLDAGHVLLTTGTQFEADAEARESEAEFAEAYVRRLRDAGIAALGFGTEVIRAGTPDALVDACARRDSRSSRCPTGCRSSPSPGSSPTCSPRTRTPARPGRSPRSAPSRSRRCVPTGSRRRSPSSRNRLGAWVGLIDAAGSLDREAPDGGLGQPALGEVVGEARSMLRRGQRASRTLVAGESVGSAAAHHVADPRRRRGAARRARHRRLRRARPGRARGRHVGDRARRARARAEPRPRPGARPPPHRACSAASSRATPRWPSGSPARCGARCLPRRSGSR